MLVLVTVIAYLAGTVLFFIWGVATDDSEQRVAMFSLAFASISVCLSLVIYFQSLKANKRRDHEVDVSLSSLQGDVDRIIDHLAVPENIHEARRLAKKVEEVEYKVDSLRYRPWWQFWRP